VTLPAGRVNSNWVLDDDARGDDFVLQFNLPADADPATLNLARWDTVAEAWVAVAPASCLSNVAYDSSYLDSLPAGVAAECPTAAGLVDVGVPHIWARLDQEGVYALITRE